MTKIGAMFAGSPRPLGPRAAPSAIHKFPMAGPWTIATSGLVGDEQADKVNHGGPDKALHHYPHEHYAVWASELPKLAPALTDVPAFGENISTHGMTEETVCIGDVYAIGAVRLQIAQGRQPCWKLNARFDIPDMAYQVQKTGRTGWYYRVLTPGRIEPDTEIKLEDRPQPKWPLSRLIALLYNRTAAFDELAAMSEVPELAEGWRKLAARRVASRKVESWSSRLEGDQS
jgi:MOSC domain-containing protein YiiM